MPRLHSIRFVFRCSVLHLALCLMILGNGCASHPQSAAPSDLPRLQGEWTMIASSVDGMTLPGMMMRSFKRVCEGNQVIVTNGEQLIMKATITIDQSKTPKSIDYDVSGGPTQGRRHLGIYELDGDTMRSCFGDPESPRPDDFVSKSGDRRTYTVWKRVTAPAR